MNHFSAIEAKALIGDITPKALPVLQEGDPVIPGAVLEEDRGVEDSDRMKVSSWNHAGKMHDSMTHSLAHSLTYSLTHSNAHSLKHSLTHSITHSFTHSLTQTLTNTPTSIVGTWEEKDMTEFSKSRITALCLLSEVRHSDPRASGSKVRAYVTGIIIIINH